MTTSQPVPALDRALRWVAANLHHFDPTGAPGKLTVEHAQPVCELAVTLHICTALGVPQIAEHERAIAGCLERVRSNPEYSDRLLRSPGGLVLLIYVYAVLRRRGLDDRAQRDMLQRVLDAGYLEHDERPPHRVMDLRLALEWAELDHDLPSWEELCDTSILARPVRVPFTDVSAAYAFTDAFFFSFGFGTSSIPSGTWLEPHAARTALSSLLVAFCQERDWDVVGELLLCWECAGLDETPLSRRAWGAFLARQQDTGAFAGPERRVKRVSEDTGADTAYFIRHYHTTLVAIMALARRHANLKRPPQSASPLHATDDALNLLPMETDLDGALARSVTWLRSLIADPQRTARWDRLDVLCRTLVAAWICGDVSGGTMDLDDLLGAIATALSSIDEDDDRWSSVPAGLKLVTAALTASMGSPVPALVTFFEQALRALGDGPPSSAEDDLPLSDKRTLLHQLGLLPQPPRQRFDELVTFARVVNLDDLQDLLALAERVDAWSGYGTRTIEPAGDSAAIVELLEGAALHCLRLHDLVHAASFIRALSRLGDHGRRTAASCCRYLLLHQQPAGRFGAFGPEKSNLARSVHGFSPEFDLDLPVTFECVRTLAETLGHPWSLYSALARCSDPTSPAAEPSVAD